MEDASTKIDNIIDQVLNENYQGIIKSIKKILSKEPNQAPRNRFLINMLKSYAFYNLKKYKPSEEALQTAFKNFSAVNLGFLCRYQFLIELVLLSTHNKSIYQQILDQFQSSNEEVEGPIARQ